MLEDRSERSHWSNKLDSLFSLLFTLQAARDASQTSQTMTFVAACVAMMHSHVFREAPPGCSVMCSVSSAAMRTLWVQRRYSVASRLLGSLHPACFWVIFSSLGHSFIHSSQFASEAFLACNFLVFPQHIPGFYFRSGGILYLAVLITFGSNLTSASVFPVFWLICLHF